VKLWSRNVFIILIIFAGLSATAMDAFEIQVYDGEINKVGQYSLETHLNHIFSGLNQGDYIGQDPANHLTHLTFEGARGITDFWELGAYFQTAITPDQQLRYSGVKLRSKFVVPRKTIRPFHLGLNFEISNIPYEFEPSRWSGEIRPIIGYNWGRLLILINPILDFDFSRGSTTPQGSPAAKIQYDTGYGYGLGAEYYADTGYLNQMRPLNDQLQYAFAVLDLLNSAYEVNIGLGTGLNDGANDFVAKAIFGFDFD
jgi:hypothetical protein